MNFIEKTIFLCEPPFMSNQLPALKIDNKTMRRMWLSTTGLAEAPTGPLDVMATIKKLGFVQLDTIQNVSRAHHHILWSRNQNYRETMLDQHLNSKEHIFEHFTHDASVIPLDYYPMWTRQFGRLKNWLDGSKRYQQRLAHADLAAIKSRITEEGALSTGAFNTKILEDKKMWSRPPHKIALDYMWYCGDLATSHRERFKKFYDLSQRVIPKHLKEQKLSDESQINWLCHAALERLGVGSAKEIRDFWAASDLKEVQSWLEGAGHVEVEWQTDDGKWQSAIAHQNIEQNLAALPSPTSRLRIINPFDPAIRDRARLKNLFGFDYKIEIFVPKHKRKWGYYVYPLLEGNRFVGRIELKADRKKGALNVTNFWTEPGVKWGEARHKKLAAELDRFARFAGLDQVNWPQQ